MLKSGSHSIVLEETTFGSENVNLHFLHDRKLKNAKMIYYDNEMLV